MREISVNKNDAGQRLDRFISKAVPLLPESLLQKYIRLKRIKLNGKGAKRDTRISEGDLLSLYVNDEFFEKPTEENSYLKVGAPKLDIVYEDENVLLVDKKIGILCHSAGKWDYNTLVSNIQAYAYQKGDWIPKEENSFAPALCNRIDQNTGGIVIAAKNAMTLRVLNDKIKEREIDKYYLCVVHGVPKQKTATLTNYLFKDAEKNKVFVTEKPVAGSKTAITDYEVLVSKNGLSLVKCKLHTGRTHQIRAQMAHLGHPLLGDCKYGTSKMNKPFGETHQLLYSYRIDFTFKTDANELNYLRSRKFFVNDVDFAKKYFDFKFKH